jgi:2'-deoxynucleoside 5'-phosphate N-hydrolase
MIIYFCGSIAGGRKYLETYTKMVRHLQSNGHVVPTEHIIEPNVLDKESQLTAAQIYERDVEWLRGADAVIAEISNPSLGVGYEISYALQCKKPVLALYAKTLFVSRMITGNNDPLLRVCEYDSAAEWRREMDSFLENLLR